MLRDQCRPGHGAINVIVRQYHSRFAQEMVIEFNVMPNPHTIGVTANQILYPSDSIWFRPHIEIPCSVVFRAQRYAE